MTGSAERDSARLAGRAAALHRVEESILGAADRPTGAIVEGDTGIGKSTLWTATIDRAASVHGFQVLAAQCAASEVGYAYTAIADLLRDRLDAAAMSGLPPPHRTALRRATTGTTEGPLADERATAAAVLAVVTALSEGAPVLIAIDDAQYLDASSRAVIAYVVRRLPARTALLATVRTAPSGTAELTLPWLQMTPREALSRIRLPAMNLGEMHALLSDRLDRTLPRPMMARIHHLSGGNPFFGLELARAIPAGSARVEVLPSSLATLIAEHVGELDDRTRSVVLAASCAATPTVEVLGIVCAMAPHLVVEALEPLEARGVIAIDGNRVRFTYPLFATGTYLAAPARRRRAMHHALANLADAPEVAARHLALSLTTADTSTLTAMDTAAEVAAAKGALVVATELVELAIDLGGDTPARRLRAAEWHFRCGAVSPSRTHLRHVLHGQPSNAVRALALAGLGAVKACDDDVEGAIEDLTTAAEQAHDAPSIRLACRIRLSLAAMTADRTAEASEYANGAVTLAERLDVPGLLSQALSSRVLVDFVRGGGVDRDALLVALDLEDPHCRAATFPTARAADAVIAAWVGDLGTAQERLYAERRRVAGEGNEIDLVWIDTHLAAVDTRAGRYDQAADTARAAVQRAERLGSGLALLTARTVRAAVAAYVGRDDDARADAGAALDAARAMGAHRHARAPLRILAFLAVSHGDYAAALTLLRPLLDGFDPPHDLEIEGAEHLPDAIEALTALGRLDEADTIAESLLKHGADRDRPWMMAVGARGRGLVLAAGGDLIGAQRAVEQALHHHRRLAMPFERARTQLLLGQVQRRRRLRVLAHDTLTAALMAFEEVGVPAWAARARAELARLRTPRGVGSQLTAAEWRTASLAARGLSNQQIAAELFLSEKTIEATLSRVYRKLGIRSRGGLAAALGPDSNLGRT